MPIVDRGRWNGTTTSCPRTRPQRAAPRRACPRVGDRPSPRPRRTVELPTRPPAPGRDRRRARTRAADRELAWSRRARAGNGAPTAEIPDAIDTLRLPSAAEAHDVDAVRRRGPGAGSTAAKTGPGPVAPERPACGVSASGAPALVRPWSARIPAAAPGRRWPASAAAPGGRTVPGRPSRVLGDQGGMVVGRSPIPRSSAGQRLVATVSAIS
jgi:hypothetical protein